MSEDVTFETLLENLQDENAILRAAIIYRLSEPNTQEFEQFKAAWPGIPEARKELLFTRMVESSETSFDLNFAAVAHFALEDDNATVRRLAIEALWEDMRLSTLARLTSVMTLDEDFEVRAAAAQATGKFVLETVLGNLPEGAADKAVKELLEICMEGAEHPDVHRRALESLAYSEREELPELIREAYAHHDIKMQASALFAMGRSADDRWHTTVLSALDHPEPELRFEAVRAAGELDIKDALPKLIWLLKDVDREIKSAAIWSLGEIGGNAAQRALMNLSEQEQDDDILEAIEEALDMATLSSGEFARHIFADDTSDDSLIDAMEAADSLGELDEFTLDELGLDELDELDALDMLEDEQLSDEDLFD